VYQERKGTEDSLSGLFLVFSKGVILNLGVMNRPLLIVEDDPHHRKALADYLEKAGYKTVTASNGVDALDLLQKSNPFGVISDIYMPEMGGLELLREIRKENTLILVVIITGDGQESSLKEALREGANNFYHKPFDFSRLNRWLSREWNTLQRIDQTPAIQFTKDFSQHLEILVKDFNLDQVMDLLIHPLQGLMAPLDLLNLQIGLEEILLNAYEHGCLKIGWEDKVTALKGGHFNHLRTQRKEEYPQSEITIDQRLQKGLMQLTITDSGGGFDHDSWRRDPEKYLSHHSGRGLILAYNYFDHIEFLGRGNALILSKAFRPL